MVWLTTFLALFTWLRGLALICDTDSYYHLAVAREYMQRGVFTDLEWARFSMMAHGFGDKDLLFHLLLAPFTSLGDPELGGKLFLAGLAATVMLTMGWLASDALGPMGLSLPVLTLCGSTSFDLRVIRLRPELLALLLLLFFVRALARERYRWAAVWSGAFALSYTAIHALLGLAVIFALHDAWRRRRLRIEIVLMPALGAVAALLVHPHFPDNLRVFYVQNVLYWTFKNTLDVGTEIRPLGIGRWLQYDWPLLAGTALLGATLRTSPPARETARDDSAGFFGVSAFAFDVLFARSGRFAVYAIPFTLLALAFAARSWGLAPTSRVHGLGRQGPRAALLLALVASIGARLTLEKLNALADRNGCRWPAYRDQLKAVGSALPLRAKVAAPWDSTADLVFWAPQGRYLNVLDPVFMRVAHPGAFAVQRRMFEGTLVDVPLALRTTLDSEYLVFEARTHLALLQRVRNDPRLQPLLVQGHVVYRVAPRGNRDFVLDYRVAERGEDLDGGRVRAYPRHSTRKGRASEGFVDARRLGDARCWWFAHDRTTAEATTVAYEFGTSGPASIWFGATRVLDARPAALVLGSGRMLRVPEGSASTRIRVRVCPANAAPPVFYLLARFPDDSGGLAHAGRGVPDGP